MDNQSIPPAAVEQQNQQATPSNTVASTPTTGTGLAKKLLKSTSTVAGMTMLSRILGFLRDMVCASVFGATPGFDAFLVAFKIPNFLRTLFAEGAFSQAFVPVLAEYREKHPEHVQQFIDRLTGCFFLSVLLVVVVAELCVPLVVLTFAPGFLHDAVRYPLTIHMLYITFPYILLISLTALSGAILNTYGKFGIPAFTPVLLNISLIVAAWWAAPHFKQPIIALAWGVIAGGIIQLASQIPAMLRIGMFPRFHFHWRDEGVKRVLKLMVPAIFGVSVAQLSLLIDSLFASFLPVGSISWLYYSDRIIFLPLGVIGVALSTVLLPQLARQHTRQSAQAYSATLEWGLRVALLVGIPCSLGVFFLAGPILATLIHHGSFNSFDVMMTARSLRAYAFGLPAFMLVKILASAFYARQQIKVPVKVAAVAMVFNLIVNFIVMKPFAHAGLAFSTACASLLNTLCLFVLLLRYGYYRPATPWWPIIWRYGVASVGMALFLMWWSGTLDTWLHYSIFKGAAHLAFTISVGTVIYFGLLFLTGLRPTHFRPPNEG